MNVNQENIPNRYPHPMNVNQEGIPYIAPQKHLIFLCHGTKIDEAQAFPPLGSECVTFSRSGFVTTYELQDYIFEFIKTNTNDLRRKDLRSLSGQTFTNPATEDTIFLRVANQNRPYGNLLCNLDGPEEEFMGFYDPAQANLFIRDDIPPEDWVKRGHMELLTEEFINNELYGNLNLRFRQSAIFDFLRRRFPNESIRLYFVSCQSFLHQPANLNPNVEMIEPAVGNLQNAFNQLGGRRRYRKQSHTSRKHKTLKKKTRKHLRR